MTYVSRNLEPYRGFHTFMRALPGLQRKLRDAHFVIVGGDGVSYGRPVSEPHQNYREQYLAEVGSNLDLARVHFTGKIPYPAFAGLMQMTRLHIYFTYPFVLSWSMLEAMGFGAPLLASSTPPVTEFVREGENGFLFDFFDQQQLLEKAADRAFC